jgi:hypothetical protein
MPRVCRPRTNSRRRGCPAPPPRATTAAHPPEDRLDDLDRTVVLADGLDRTYLMEAGVARPLGDHPHPPADRRGDRERAWFQEHPGPCVDAGVVDGANRTVAGSGHFFYTCRLGQLQPSLSMVCPIAGSRNSRVGCLNPESFAREDLVGTNGLEPPGTTNRIVVPAWIASALRDVA